MPIHACVVNGLSWRSGQRSSSETKDFAHADATDGSISQFQEHGSQSPSLYEVARHELRELEFEPLCQQSAARILANNCELLGTKNEATILTTSGRLVRDFVDSYAIGLAICDLERGNFEIPHRCANFREPVLSQLPVQNFGHLHVSSAEIKSCLSGLSDSSSA